MKNCFSCPNLIFSESVTFAADTLTVNIREGSYRNGECFCLLINRTIPTATTITAPVVITIGDGTEEYPLVDRCCAPVLASGLRTRTRYQVQVATTATGGNFKLLGRTCCTPSNRLAAIDGTAPAAGA